MRHKITRTDAFYRLRRHLGYRENPATKPFEVNAIANAHHPGRSGTALDAKRPEKKVHGHFDKLGAREL